MPPLTPPRTMPAAACAAAVERSMPRKTRADANPTSKFVLGSSSCARSAADAATRHNILRSHERIDTRIDVFVFRPVVHTLVAMNFSSWIGIAAGLTGFLGVGLGAFGAHGLKETLEAHNGLDNWRTAVMYHLVHAVALFALAAWRGTGAAQIASCWLVGILLFSGSLYWLALGGSKAIWPATPLGGLAFLSGWALVAW